MPERFLVAPDQGLWARRERATGCDRGAPQGAYDPFVATMAAVHPPASGDWIEVVDVPLPVDVATAWATTPASGAVVVFLGVVRDHADGRGGVTGLTYEAYQEEAVARDSPRWQPRRAGSGR